MAPSSIRQGLTEGESGLFRPMVKHRAQAGGDRASQLRASQPGSKIYTALVPEKR
jgi:hypothetical protein